MTARESSAVENAVTLVLKGGLSLSAAARACECNVSSVRRALRRRGVAPLGAVSGDKHHAFKGEQS